MCWAMDWMLVFLYFFVHRYRGQAHSSACPMSEILRRVRRGGAGRPGASGALVASTSEGGAEAESPLAKVGGGEGAGEAAVRGSDLKEGGVRQ